MPSTAAARTAKIHYVGSVLGNQRSAANITMVVTSATLTEVLMMCRAEHRGHGRYSEDPRNRDTSKFIVSDTLHGLCYVRSSRDEAEELALYLGGHAQGVYVFAMPDSEVTTGQQIVAAHLQQRARTSGGSRGCSSAPNLKPYLSSTRAPVSRNLGRGNEFPEHTEYGQESGPLDESGDDSGLAHYMSTVTRVASILSPRTRARVPSSPGISAGRSRGSNSGASGSRPSVGGGTSASSIAYDSSGRSGLSQQSGGGSHRFDIRWPSPQHRYSLPNPANLDKREGRPGEMFCFAVDA